MGGQDKLQQVQQVQQPAMPSPTADPAVAAREQATKAEAARRQAENDTNKSGGLNPMEDLDPGKIKRRGLVVRS